MKKLYTHLSKNDRNALAILHNKGYSLRDIARALDRSVSTISAELKRNAVTGATYTSATAETMAYIRRSQAKFQAMHIVQNAELRIFIERELLRQQSPYVIAGRLATGVDGLPSISRDTIDRYIRSVHGRQLQYELKLLTYKTKPRKKRPVSRSLEDRAFIDSRPEIITNRLRVGDLEADFIVSGKSGAGALLTAVDRKTRFGFIRLILPINIVNVEQAFIDIRDVFPELTSLTLDNDILFRNHEQLAKLLNVPIYFTEPYASWQKGSVESYNRYVRKYVPKGVDISHYEAKYLQTIEDRLNDRFMSVLGYQTPKECLYEHRRNVSKNC